MFAVTLLLFGHWPLTLVSDTTDFRKVCVVSLVAKGKKYLNLVDSLKEARD
jgi:hypothetical protein